MPYIVVKLPRRQPIQILLEYAVMVQAEDKKTITGELAIQLIPDPSKPYARADYFQVAAVNNSNFALSGYQLDYQAAALGLLKPPGGGSTETNQSLVLAMQVFRAVTDRDGFVRLRDQINEIAKSLGIE
jgi:hypothetical protein